MDRLRIHTLALPAIACLLLVLPKPLLPQSITGDILGSVQDSSGAVVPGATVILTGMDTGGTQTATTDAGGNYLFAQLKPGRYSLAASKEGFQTQTVSQVELLVGQRPRVDITLAVGAVSQRVEVSAGGVQLLETQTSAMGQVIQERPVQELPLNGRNLEISSNGKPTI